MLAVTKGEWAAINRQAGHLHSFSSAETVGQHNCQDWLLPSLKCYGEPAKFLMTELMSPSSGGRLRKNTVGTICQLARCRGKLWSMDIIF